MAKKKTYEELVGRLEEILNLLDDSDLELEQSIKLYKEGMDLVVKCNKYLSDYETQISEIKKTTNNSFKLIKFD